MGGTAGQLSRREALLAAFFPVAAISLLNHFYLASLHKAGPAALWTVDVLQFAVIPCACAVFLARRGDVSAADLGLVLKRRNWHDQDFWGNVLAVPVCIALVGWLMFKIVEMRWWAYAEVFPTQSLPPPSLVRTLLAAYMAMSAGLVEEVFWRALPWLYFRDTVAVPWRRTAYVLSTSIMFAIAHSEQGPGGMLGALLFGLWMAMIYTKIRTPWPAILGHALLDFILFVR